MSLSDYLYSEKFIPDVINRYVEELKSSRELSDIMHANKLRVYRKMIFDDDYLEEIQEFFNKCFDLVKEKYSVLRDDKKTVGCSIDGRRKGLIQAEEKCRLYLQQGLSLNLIRDFFAFRFVLYGNDNDLQKYCYKVTEDIIDLAIREGFTICEALPLVETISNINSEEVYPQFKYAAYIKDYIRFPKKNGYQSIHFVLVDLYGRHLEIQVRTDSMHLLAEKNARQSHLNYKGQRYKSRLIDKIDREKISIVGYKCLPKRVQIIEFLEDKIDEEHLSQISHLLADNKIFESNLDDIKGILSNYDDCSDWITYILGIKDEFIDLAGVETGVSIFHRQTF